MAQVSVSNTEFQNFRKEVREEFDDSRIEFETFRKEVKDTFANFRTEFDDYRKEVREEFDEFRAEFNGFRTEFDGFRKEVREEFVGFRSEIKEIKDTFVTKTTFDELKVTVHQMDARSRNNHLKNPTLIIRPVPTFDPISDRIVQPDPELFPEHANEFYALRNPSTKRQHQLLDYLVKFYDLSQFTGSSSSKEAKKPLRLDPERAVELLEDILGLQEDNFIAFRERARRFTGQPSAPAKREQPFSSERELQRRPASDRPGTARQIQIRRRHNRRPAVRQTSTHLPRQAGDRNDHCLFDPFLRLSLLPFQHTVPKPTPSLHHKHLSRYLTRSRLVERQYPIPKPRSVIRIHDPIFGGA